MHNSFSKLTGLLAAPFTPLAEDGSVRLDFLPRYVEHLVQSGVSGAMVCGSTGEGNSLTIRERKQILEVWTNAAAGRLRVIAHVGHSSVEDSRDLAKHAALVGADAICATPSSRTLPPDLETLTEWCSRIAAGAPDLPFYYYHIPSASGVAFPMRKFLQMAGAHLPTLRGIKFTHEDMLDYQVCLQLDDGRYDLPFGRDEFLLGALSVGATSAIGSTYNLFPDLYLKMIAAFHAGSRDEARRLQRDAAVLISIFLDFGGLPAIKAAMGYLGLGMGPTRTPLRALKPDEISTMWKIIERENLSCHFIRA